MAAITRSISVEASQTRRHFRDLCHDIAVKAESNTVPDGVDADGKYLADCLDRFNIWAGSLGVFQKGEASLDARLSNHILAREVLRLLKQLDTVVSDLRDIIDGKREQTTWSRSSLRLLSDDFSDTLSWSDEEQQGVMTPESSPEDEVQANVNFELITESKDLHLSVDEAITSLLRLSVQIHKSSRKAKFAKSSVDKDYAIDPDISHALDFFPHLDTTGNVALAERLGKANAQRRQWLWYRRRHREKLSVDFSGAAPNAMPPLGEWSEGHRVQGQYADTEIIALFSVDEEGSGANWTPSLVSDTKASTFRSRPTAGSLLSPSNAPPETLFGRSSKAAASEQKLLAPQPPHDLVLNQPYSCRYCCNIVEISGRHAWQKHVHSDLSSYTCLAENCDEIFFESRKKWWAHEMEAHRKKWTCGICKANVLSMANMKTHLKEVHTNQVRVDQVNDVAYRFGRPVSYFHASDCPLCDYPTLLRQRGLSEKDIAQVPVEKFGRHLGRHLEQLALFVLPSNDLGDENDMSDEEREGESVPGDSDSESGQHETLPEPELMQRLAEIISSQRDNEPEKLPGSPDLAVRWQPPQDFTPPLEDFDAEDADNLPVRQEPIYGGDLHTPGWARGIGSRKEGFCARCPVSHWVNITDGSYRFHLTYFHGVPDSGVPLPRPSTIRPVQDKADVWEGFCNACDDWKVLKKTTRGWNWYRHWLNNHADIVKHQTEAIRNGANPETIQLQQEIPKPRAEGSTEVTIDLKNPKAMEEALQQNPGLLQNTRFTTLQLAFFAANGMAVAMEALLTQAAGRCTKEKLRTLANAKLKTGETLLMVSAAQGLGRIVQLLMDFGANPNVVAGPDHQTALDYAADAGYFAVAQQLVAGGADASQSHLFKRILSNEREYAGENTTIDAEQQAPSGLASKIDPGMLGPLGRAAFSGDMASAAKLLAGNDLGGFRCDIDEGAEIGCSAFLLASMRDHFETMELLLSHGANINTTSKHGWTPLMLASKRGNEGSVRWLIDRGADVNHLSPDRWTALAEATIGGYTRIMGLLLDAGADPEIRAQSDWAPLMHAAYRGDIEAVNILLDAGASFEEISARDETVMLLAAAAGSPTVVRRLLDAGCPPDSMWSRAVEVHHANKSSEDVVPEDAVASLKLQERIERVYKVGWTPLMVASQVGDLEIVTMLLDAGANPEPKSPMFKTALEIAKENGKLDVVHYLERKLAEGGVRKA